MQNQEKIVGIIYVAVMILFVLLGSQCQKDRLQIQKLQEELADKRGNLEEELAEKKEVIAGYTEEIEYLRMKIAVYSRVGEYITETGFIRKDGVYMIDDVSQLENISQMIKDGAEIESGVAAAEASYRLRNNLQVKDWFSIGTDQIPFCGSFDGDWHSIRGNLSGYDNSISALFLLGKYGDVRNLEIRNDMNKFSEEAVFITVGDEKECTKMEDNLMAFPYCKVSLSVEAWNLDTQKMADILQEHYERNQDQENYYISVFFDPEDVEEESVKESHTENAMTPFRMLAGEEWGKMIEEAMEQEKGYLRFIKLEQLEGIKCCTFEIGELDSGSRRIGEGYHIILEGEWEGKQVPVQHLFIPYTESELYALGNGNRFYIIKKDINFDGKQDLLIHEGFSGGSEGNLENYRAIVFKEEAGQFEYYPSFPEQILFMGFDDQRVGSGGMVSVIS